MEQRVRELDTDRKSLLELISQQESSYKDNLENSQQEVNKLKEVLKKALETKSHIETKLQHSENEHMAAVRTIATMKVEGTALIKEFEEKMLAKDKALEELNTRLTAAQEEITKLQVANQDEREDLQRARNSIQGEVGKLKDEAKSLKDQLRVFEERLKLKEEEIYEIKENYEKQIEDLSTVEDQPDIDQPEPVRIFPILGTPIRASSTTSSKREFENRRDEESKRATIKLNNLQDKIHNLTEKLFAVRGTLLERETEITALKDVLKRKEIIENNLQTEIEAQKNHRKKLQEELNTITKLKEDLQIRLKRLQQKHTTETQDLGKQLKESLRKIELFKNEIASKAGTSMSADRLGGSDLSKLIGKMLNILKKSKKVIELKDNEIADIKKQLLESLTSKD